MNSVSIDKLPNEIQKRLDEWSNKVYKEMSESVLETSLETKQVIKKNMPRRNPSSDRKNYVDCFTVLPNEKHSRNRLKRTIHNDQYQLSHLLEDGHNVYTRPRGTKRVKGVPKLGPFVIKHRSAKGSPTSRVKDSMTTTSYNAWKNGEEYGTNFLRKSVIDRISKIKAK